MRTIQTILYDDNPTWVKTTEFTNRLTKWLYIPRFNIKDLSNYKIDEYSNAWIYFLIWEDEEWKTLVYVWQATDISNRLNQHNKDVEKEDFWNIAVVFTTKENSLNESDINYLERESISKAKNAGRVDVLNKTVWNTCLIAPQKKADLDEFISDMEVLLWNLWFDFLKESKKSKNKHRTLYYLKNRWSKWEWEYVQDWFLVYKDTRWPKELVDSQIKNRWTAYVNRPKLLERWIIREEWNEIIFNCDYLFNSPSTAAIVVSWRSMNWWKIWKTQDWKTLWQIERGDE